MDKKSLTEADIRTKFITPALIGAHGDKWDLMTQIREEAYFTKGRVIVRGKTVQRGEAKKADYLLFYKPNLPIAVIEAKDNHHSVGAGMQQALEYAEILDVPFAYSSNGDAFLEHDRTVTGGVVTREIPLDQFPRPDELWNRYCIAKGLTDQQIAVATQDYFEDGSQKSPRYYQLIAINRTVEAIARGENRILLVMATGTGKTYTAFQIIWRLWKAGTKKRILFLVDRNILADQTKTNDFKPFGKAMTKITNRTVDKAYEIYLCLYQAVTGTAEEQNIYREFSPDFFDLVIVDECHRGSAAENSLWRAVLDRFSGAVQLGLTATPRDDTVSSYEYFGNPVFTYSLRQGIEDGYLAPYRVRRVVLTPDAEGWEPSPGEIDRYGRDIPDGIYSTRDFERVVSLLARTRLAAAHLSRLLREHPRPRVIVFCVDTDHAADMRRALIDANPDSVRRDPEWVVRIVGVEGERQRLLDDFTDPTRQSPTIATTSRLLSTGVDVEDLTHVVLFRPVGSMIEFKQIVGRGTRLYPDAGKTSFEIVDYVGATEKFNDIGFDGYPARITVERIDSEGLTVDTTVEEPIPGVDLDGPGGTPLVEPDGPFVNEPEPTFAVESGGQSVNPDEVRRKYYVDNGDFDVVSETRLVPSTSSGRLELTEYGTFVRDRIRALGDAEDLRRIWAQADSRRRLRDALKADGIDLRELVEAAGTPDADPLDALYHLAWNLPARTRSERVRNVREAHHDELRNLSQRARSLLEGLLERYEVHGVADLETTGVFQLEPLSRIGSVSELAHAAGGPARLREQLSLVQEWLYSA